MARRVLAVCLACLFTVCGFPAESRAGATGARDECRARPHHHAPARLAEPRAPDTRQVRRMSADLRRRLVRVKAGRRSGHARKAVEVITVPLWVHVIKDGALGAPDSAVRRQVDALNAAYGGKVGGADTGFRFELKGITHTANSQWFRDPVANEDPMKRKLRTGGPETLNLYVGQLSQLVLGYATYPYWYKDEPQLDGVVIDWRSMPGGPLVNFDRGYTAVHEIGHWFGLLHTFENGCEPPGDFVDDTPPEASPSSGCPGRRDSCPSPGEDPVHNFMDYGYDRCMYEFTAGQAARMHEMWDAYRRSQG